MATKDDIQFSCSKARAAQWDRYRREHPGSNAMWCGPFGRELRKKVLAALASHGFGDRRKETARIELTEKQMARAEKDFSKGRTWVSIAEGLGVSVKVLSARRKERARRSR